MQDNTVTSHARGGKILDWENKTKKNNANMHKCTHTAWYSSVIGKISLSLSLSHTHTHKLNLH